jgi:IS30 family transposase
MGHITEAQRYAIEAMRKAGKSQAGIAVVIGKHKSVVSREIRRNGDQRCGAYRCGLAQRKYADRQAGKAKKVRFTASMADYVEDGLLKKYSPEQIAGRARKEGVFCVSHGRIYQHVWDDKRKGGSLHKHLRSSGERYRKRGNGKDKRGQIAGRVDISQRPAIVDERERSGDLEIDTIIGKGHKGAIVTINDRASGMPKMKKLEGRDAGQLAAATIELLKDWQPMPHTITADNGKEFAAHATISTALGAAFFFARPYHSWERDSNENLNGLVRQYIPKQTDFSTITDEYVVYVENELNNRPRKRHNFDTPNTIFNQLINQDKVAFVT